MTSTVRLAKSVAHESLGCGSMAVISDIALSRLVMSLRLEAISAANFPLVSRRTGNRTSGTKGTSSQKWYFPTNSR